MLIPIPFRRFAPHAIPDKEPILSQSLPAPPLGPTNPCPNTGSELPPRCKHHDFRSSPDPDLAIRSGSSSLAADPSRVSRERTYSGTLIGRLNDFDYGTVALCGARFHVLRLSMNLVTAARLRTAWTKRPTTPGRQRVRAYTGRMKIYITILFSHDKIG
jgi:hypothetical protein